jgi:cell division protein FtsZ
MAVGQASGEDRATKAAEMAISNQLLDVTIDGARGILFNVTGGDSLKLFEVNQAAAIIKETAHPEVNLIFGAVIDESMGENLRITVIATGFEGTSISAKASKAEARRNDYAKQRPLPRMMGKEDYDTEEISVERNSSNSYEFPTRINTDDLDVPAFLRKRNQN